MAAPDKVLRQSYGWLRASVRRAIDASAVAAGDRAAVERAIWQMLGVVNAAAPPADPAALDTADFADTGAAAESIARATQVAGEVLVALDILKDAVDALRPGGNPAAALGLVGPVIRQIQRLKEGLPNANLPSAFSLAKLLLMLSGDARAEPAAGREAARLAALVGATGAADVDRAQTAMAFIVLLLGSAIDRSFKTPSTLPATGWVTAALPSFAGKPRLVVAGPPGLGATLEFDIGAATAVRAALDLNFRAGASLEGTASAFDFSASAGVGLLLPVLPPGPARVSGAFEVGLGLARRSDAGALVIGSDALGVTLSVGEIGFALKLRNGQPRMGFYARQARATLKPTDGFLKLILGAGITVDFAVEAEADAQGQLRLTNGTGLQASLPVPTLPTGPFSLQGIRFGIEPEGGSFLRLKVELSASFGVALGPFQAAVDRLGVLLALNIDDAGSPLAFAFKPPNGIGLALDAGIVKGGGYLQVDEQGYAGTLELKMLAVNVKAIAILNTKSDAGFSLLLLIFGQFPAIQLSFGFTLTGVGGLIGVQHTADPAALSRGIGNGALDAVLFPANPVGDAPRIIATLRTLFPVKRGGFVIGPMLELGWGTPSLVTVRLGLLVEASQFTILGQAIVQLPPLVSADLALLYLRLDFVGSVVFDPLRIAFDAKLVNSRVAFISITGQFAFRAAFGSNPSFLISAGGFHPRFKEIPADIPMPFDRVGASFDIGIVGIGFKGYFAITSATIQAGSSLRVWADIGIAAIEGGFGFDAICYLVPKFYFEVDLHAYLAVEVFGIDFASVHLEGLLAGPGRWRIAGRASVHTPWPLPDFSLHVDEAWGTDRATPQVKVDVAAALAKEIANTANWSAQLPRGGEAFLALAEVAVPDGTLLAHPLGTLVFQQKLVPLELRLAKASGSLVEGANEFFGGALVMSQAGGAAAGKPVATRTDFFATAQFLEMSQDDRLAKPSFEPFAAGYELDDDAYEVGTVVAQSLGYEEADLGTDRTPHRGRRLGAEAYLDARHGALLAFGAAGRSPLRDRAAMQPAQATPLRVNPPPVVVANRSALTAVAGGAAYASVWQAEQARGAAGAGVVASARAATQVAEVAELAMVVA